MANKSIRSLSARKGLEYNLFEKIADLSKNNGSETDFQELSKQFFIDDSVVLGTASFYDFIKADERKRKIRVCNGTACMVAGSQDEVQNLLKPHFESEDIGHVACIGHCHSNGAVMYQDHTYSIGSKEQLNQMMKSKGFTTQFENKYHIDTNTTPILTGQVDDVSSFFKLAELYTKKKDDVINELKLSKLRGRGGAGFPFWFKLDAVSKEVNQQKYIVCNADEGDPGAFSDMYLMEHQPFKVLFGMYLSGRCVGANTGVLYIRGEYPESIRTIENAINYLNEHHLIGDFKFKYVKSIE